MLDIFVGLLRIRPDDNYDDFVPDSPRDRLIEAIEAVASAELPDEFDHSFLTNLGEGRYARTIIHVVRGPDGKHRFGGAELITPTDGMRDEELRRPDLRALVQRAIYEQVGGQVLDTARVGEDGQPDIELQAAAFEHYEEIAPLLDRKARELNARGPYKLTEEFLADIVQQTREAGRGALGKVATEHDVSQRTVRRWLAEARERGLR